MTGKTKNKKSWRAFRLVGLALIMVGCLVRAIDPYPIRTTRLVYFDILQRLSPRSYDPALPIRVVDIDEDSLGKWGQWPWPRTLLAEMVQRLGEYGAAAVAFDMLFVEPDRYSPSRLLNDPKLTKLLSAQGDAAQLDNDVLFGSAIVDLPVVMGVAARLTESDTQVVPKAGIVEIGERPAEGLFSVPHWTPLAAPLGRDAAGIGGVNVTPLDGTGVVRRVPVLWRGPNGVMPGLGLEALRVATGEPVIFAEGAPDEAGIMLGVELAGFLMPTTENGEVWVRYRRDDPRLYVSAEDILQVDDDPTLRSKIEGRIVLVGTSAAGLFDIHQTALGESVPGVSIHAQVIEQILLGENLTRSDVTAALELLAFICLGVVVTVVMSKFGAVASFLAGGISAAVVLMTSWLAFQNQSVLFDATFPLAGGIANFGLLVGYLFISTEREKRVIRQMFGHYVAPEILDEMDASGHTLQLGGETQPITVMFSDIRGFTPLSEKISAVDLVALLNELFSVIGDQILHERGTIDKFIGDAVMAFWNAPLPVEDHPRRAAQAALLMRRALVDFNASEVMRGHPPISLATGCATGQACVGNIGSRRRFNYTVIGDVVNVASRIEENCRHVEYDILVSKSVFEATENELAMLEAGLVFLKGKTDLEPVYVLVGDKLVEQSAEYKKLDIAHQGLLTAIRARQPQSEIETLCRQCAALGERIEPGLRAFYGALPGRTADFRIDVVSGEVVFSHKESGQKTSG